MARTKGELACDECIHAEVCSQKTRFKETVKAVDELMCRLDNPKGSIDFIQQPVELKCKNRLAKSGVMIR